MPKRLASPLLACVISLPSLSVQAGHALAAGNMPAISAPTLTIPALSPSPTQDPLGQDAKGKAPTNAAAATQPSPAPQTGGTAPAATVVPKPSGQATALPPPNKIAPRLRTVEQGVNADPPLEKSTLASPSSSHSSSNPVAPPHPCLADFATSMGGTGAFSGDGSAFYHLSNLGAAPKVAAGKEQNYHYGLHRVDLARSTNSLLLSLAIPEPQALLLTGVPAKGAAALVFKNKGSPCLEGSGDYAAFSLLRPPSIKTEPRTPPKMAFMRGQGQFKVVAGSEGAVLYDTQQQSVIEFDFEKMQSRPRLVAQNPGETLLFAHLQNNQRYSWQFTQEPLNVRGIVAYNSNRTVAGAIKYEGNDRLLQQGSLFGALAVRNRGLLTQVVEPKRWSGAPRTQTYPLTLPAELSLPEALVHIHFMKKLLVVGAATQALRKIWRQVYIFDYARDKLIASFVAPPEHYIDYFGLAPRGDQAMLEVRNLGTGATAYLVAFQTDTQRWTKIPVSVLRPQKPATAGSPVKAKTPATNGNSSPARSR